MNLNKKEVKISKFVFLTTLFLFSVLFFCFGSIGNNFTFSELSFSAPKAEACTIGGRIRCNQCGWQSCLDDGFGGGYWGDCEMPEPQPNGDPCPGDQRCNCVSDQCQAGNAGTTFCNLCGPGTGFCDPKHWVCDNAEGTCSEQPGSGISQSACEQNCSAGDKFMCDGPGVGIEKCRPSTTGFGFDSCDACDANNWECELQECVQRQNGTGCPTGGCQGGGGGCGGGPACTPPQTCQGGICAAPPFPRNPCVDDSDCAAGQICDNGSCIADPNDCANVVCGPKQTCVFGICIDDVECQGGVDTRPCNDCGEEDCGANDQWSGVCVGDGLDYVCNDCGLASCGADGSLGACSVGDPSECGGGDGCTPACTGCDTCVNGVCVSSCTGCDTCVNGVCTDSCTGCNTCVDGTCQSSCGECETCSAGECVSTCGACDTCVNGSCVSSCTGCTSCVNGACVDSCSGCDTCVNGACVSTCGDCETCDAGTCVTSCGDCETCVNGACTSSCQTCETCSGGSCVPDPTCCSPLCGNCEICSNSSCVTDPACCSPACGECETCSDGQCTSTCGYCEICSGGSCAPDPACCDPCDQGGDCYDLCACDPTSQGCNIGTCNPGEGRNCSPCGTQLCDSSGNWSSCPDTHYEIVNGVCACVPTSGTYNCPTDSAPIVTNMALSIDRCTGIATQDNLHLSWTYSSPPTNYPQTGFTLQVSKTKTFSTNQVIDAKSVSGQSPNTNTVILHIEPDAAVDNCLMGNGLSNVCALNYYGSASETYYWRVKVTGVASGGVTKTSDWYYYTSTGGTTNQNLAQAYTPPIKPSPLPSFTFSPSPAEMGKPVAFTDLSSCYDAHGVLSACKNSSNNNYSWYFGLVDTSNVRGDVSHTFNTSGNQNTVLYVCDTSNNNTCCTSESIVTVRDPNAINIPSYKEIPPF